MAWVGVPHSCFFYDARFRILDSGDHEYAVRACSMHAMVLVGLENSASVYEEPLTSEKLVQRPQQPVIQSTHPCVHPRTWHLKEWLTDLPRRSGFMQAVLTLAQISPWQRHDAFRVLWIACGLADHLPRELYVVPFWVVYIVVPNKKAGHNQKGTTYESPGRGLLAFHLVHKSRSTAQLRGPGF